MNKFGYLVRTKFAGVFYTPKELTERSQDGLRGTALDARRIWYWKGAASLSQLAVDGPQVPKECKFPCAVEWVELTEIIEILPVTEKAKKQLEKVKVWEE